MAVIILTSGPGAPGTTTAALTLALSWPRHVLLADCDRDPGHPVLAGYLRGMDAGGRGLPSVAQAHREQRVLDDELWLHTLPLMQGAQVERRFLPGFAAPQAVALFAGVWHPLGEAFEALDARGVDVVVDAGRIGTNGLAEGLLARADAVLVVVGSHLRSLAGLRLHLPTLAEQLRQMPTDIPHGLFIVGPGRPYRTDEITDQFATSCWATLPWDPKAAGVLLDGHTEPRRFDTQGFMGRARSVAQQIDERVHGLRASREALIHD